MQFCKFIKRRCCKLKKINAVLNFLMISDLHLKCKVKICGMNNNRLLYIVMYNMEIYCTSLYCIENPYWTRRRRLK